MAGFTDNMMLEDLCIRVFNPEIKKLVGVFKNGAKAATRLGVAPTTLHRKCGKKERIFSPIYNAEFACRAATITEEDKILIKKTEIKFPYDL
jgi:hypothetical protein